MTEKLTTEQVEEILALAEKVDGTGRLMAKRRDKTGLDASSLATELLALRKRVGEVHLLAASIRDIQTWPSRTRDAAQRILELTRPSEHGTADNAPLPTPKEPS
jgi:hypothetical protein